MQNFDLNGSAATPLLEPPAPVLTWRDRLTLSWQAAWAGDFIECEPGCTNGWDQIGSCAECRALELADRAAW